MAIDWSKASEVKQTASGPDWGKARPVKDDSGELDSLRDYAFLMARNYGVEEFLPTMFEIESAFGANKNDSPKGAVGPMQMMPDTFNQYKDKGWDIRNPKHNIEASARMLAELKGKYGDDKDAVVAYYNSGREKERAMKISETRDYVKKFRKLSGQEVAEGEEGRDFRSSQIVSNIPAIEKLEEIPAQSVQQKKFAEQESLLSYIAKGLRGVGAAEADLGASNPNKFKEIQDDAYDPNFTKQAPLGVVHGVGDLFGILAKPLDYAIEKLTDEPVDSRKQFSNSLREMGADPDQPAFKVGRIGGNLAVANVAPNSLAAGMEKIGAETLANSIRNWGFAKNTGKGAWEATKGYLTNVLGGGLAGGSSAYSLNPDESPALDAGVGALLPGVGIPLSKAVVATGNTLIPKAAKMAHQVLDYAGLSPNAVRAQLLRGQSAVLPEVVQDVPRLLQNPDVSYLVSRLGPDPNALWASRTGQRAAMENALEGIAPTISDVNNRPSTVIGQQIAEPLRAQYEAEKLLAKDRFNQVDPNFANPDLQEVSIHMPFDKVDAIMQSRLPESVVSEGSRARELVNSAKSQFIKPPDAMELALDPTAESTQIPMNWDDWQNWRKNFSDTIGEVRGEREKAALVELKKLMDSTMQAGASPIPFHPDDFVSPGAWQRYQEANTGWQNFKNQYEKRLGPIFKSKKGEYTLAEDQIPDKIYTAGDTQRETAQQFMDIAGGQSDLTSPIKSYITTSAKKAFDTSKKGYLKWLGDRASANSALLNRSEMERLNELGRLLRAEVSEEGLLMQGGSAGNSYSNVNKIIGDSLDNPFIDSLLNGNRTVGIVSRPLLRRLRGRTDYENRQLLATLLADPNKFLDAMETPLTNSWHSSSDNMLNVLRNTQPTFPAITNNNQEMR